MSADWTGSGRLQCYGVVDTDVSTPAGGNYLERGNLRCTLEEWVYETGRGPEAMFFKPVTGGEFEVWAVSRDSFQSFTQKIFEFNITSGTTIRPIFPMLNATETSGTRTTTWELATACPTRDSMAVDTAIVLERLPATAARESARVLYLATNLVIIKQYRQPSPSCHCCVQIKN